MNVEVRNGKVNYKDWCRFVEDVEELLGFQYSLTDVSNIVKKERGWADSARQHRSVVEPRDIRKIRKAVMAERKKRQTGKPADLKPSEQKLALSMMDELRAYEVPWASIDSIIGYKGGGAYAAYKNEGKMSRERFKRLQSEVQKFRAEPEKYIAGLTPTHRTPTARKPSKNGKGAPNDAFSWMDEIHVALKKHAQTVEDNTKSLPQKVRQPFLDLKGMMEELASEFKR